MEGGYKKTDNVSHGEAEICADPCNGLSKVLCSFQSPVAWRRPSGPCLATRAGFIALRGRG